MKKFPLFLCIVILTAVCLTGCSASPGADDRVSAEAVSKSEAVSSGWEMQIDTVTLDGEAVTSADFAANKLTVLNIWATWCPPCIAELPHLQEMNEAFRDQGVEIVGVLQDGISELGVPVERTIADANKLLQDAGADYRMILPDAAILNTFIAQMQYFPTTFFLDAQGNVVETVIGANSADDWREIIGGVLEEVS